MPVAEKVDVYKPGARLLVFGLTEWEKRGGDKGTTWTKIGRASTNKDGSVNIYLDFAPLRGQTLQIRPAKEGETRYPDGAPDF